METETHSYGSQPEQFGPPSRGHLAISRDDFALSQLERDATGIEWLEARNAAKHPMVHRTTQQHSAQSTEVEKRCPQRMGDPAGRWGVGQIIQRDNWGWIHGGGRDLKLKKNLKSCLLSSKWSLGPSVAASWIIQRHKIGAPGN